MRQGTDFNVIKTENRLLELIARKQDESLASKSIEELTAMVESL